MVNCLSYYCLGLWRKALVLTVFQLWRPISDSRFLHCHLPDVHLYMFRRGLWWSPYFNTHALIGTTTLKIETCVQKKTYSLKHPLQLLLKLHLFICASQILSIPAHMWILWQSPSQEQNTKCPSSGVEILVRSGGTGLTHRQTRAVTPLWSQHKSSNSSSHSLRSAAVGNCPISIRCSWNSSCHVGKCLVHDLWLEHVEPSFCKQSWQQRMHFDAGQVHALRQSNVPQRNYSKAGWFDYVSWVPNSYLQ